MAISAAPVYNKAIYCDQTVTNEDGDVKLISELHNANKVKSITEMANSLHASNNINNKNYNFIMLCGHGKDGRQGLGNGWNAYAQKKEICHGLLADIAPEIAQITGALNTNNVVKPVFFLAGCEVGNGKNGTRLLRELSVQIPNVLIVAAEHPLTYKQHLIRNKLVDISIHKLIKHTQSGDPIDFKFAFNGNIIDNDTVQYSAGVEYDDLYDELTNVNNELK